MTKIIKYLTLIILLSLPIFVFAESRSSYELTADTQIFSRGGELCSILVMTDGSNDGTVILYDVNSVNDIASTNKLVEIKVKGADNYGGRIWAHPVRFSNGVYADVTGTGVSFIVEWLR